MIEYLDTQTKLNSFTDFEEREYDYASVGGSVKDAIAFFCVFQISRHEDLASV